MNSMQYPMAMQQKHLQNMQSSSEMANWQNSMGPRHAMPVGGWGGGGMPPNASIPVNGYSLMTQQQQPHPMTGSYFDNSMQPTKMPHGHQSLDYVRMTNPAAREGPSTGGSYFMTNGGSGLPGSGMMVNGMGQNGMTRGMSAMDARHQMQVQMQQERQFNHQIPMSQNSFNQLVGGGRNGMNPAIIENGLPPIAVDVGNPGHMNGKVMGPSSNDLKMSKSAAAYGGQRMTPYPNPQQYMQTKRAQYNGRQQQPTVYNGPQSQQSQSQPQPWSPTGWPRQPQGPALSPGYPASQMRPQLQYPANAFNQPTYPSGCQSPPGRAPAQLGGGGPVRNYDLASGNPTPPTTPGVAGPPFYPSPDGPDGRMNGVVNPRGFYRDEPRFLFMMRDGLIVSPFRLEHNLSITNRTFQIHDQTFQNLMNRPDLDLQLKCFHNEDRTMTTNWPASLTISVNRVQLPIDRGDHTAPQQPHQPLYLKNLCQAGQNLLQIAVTACCCSHLFVVQIVHRPTVRNVLENLLKTRLVPADRGIAKIKRALIGNGDDSSVKFSLVCPISLRRMTLPTRGLDCQHIQCFDLESYLRLNCDTNAWLCPICKKSGMVDTLEIDQYIWSIVKHLGGTRIDEILLDSMGNWRPSIYEPESAEGNSRLWKKAMNLDSMQLPTVSTWLANQQSAPPGQLPPTAAPGGQQVQGGFNGSAAGQQNGPQYHDPASQRYPPSSGPTDYLGCLSQLSNSILSEDSSNNNRPPAMDHTSFPPTPMGSQLSTSFTPLDGQSLHPRTPSDGNSTHPHTPPEGLTLPRTPMECSASHPKTPLEGNGLSSGNPRTPVFESCSGLLNKRNPTSLAASNGCMSTSSSTNAGVKQSNASAKTTESSEFKTAESSCNLDFTCDLNIGSMSAPDDGNETGNLTLLQDTFDDDLSLYLGPTNDKPSTDVSIAPSQLDGDDILSLFR